MKPFITLTLPQLSIKAGLKIGIFFFALIERRLTPDRDDLMKPVITVGRRERLNMVVVVRQVYSKSNICKSQTPSVYNICVRS